MGYSGTSEVLEIHHFLQLGYIPSVDSIGAWTLDDLLLILVTPISLIATNNQAQFLACFLFPVFINFFASKLISLHQTFPNLIPLFTSPTSCLPYHKHL